MTKRLLISVDAAERRIAVVDGDQLENLILEAASEVANRGNIFKGVVKRVEPSLQAAFIDYGGARDGFLAVDEIHPGLVPAGVDRRAPIQKLIRAKQPLLVQVTKDEVGTKGAALSTYISLAGRFLVLMPESERTGISRKLSDEERRRLKEVLKDVELPDGFGVIARTAAKSVTKADALKDLSYLTRLWTGIDRRFEEMRWPGLIYQEQNLAIRFVRDYFTNDIDEIWIDDHDSFQEVNDFVGVLMPKQQPKVRLYTDEEPLFTKFGVEDHIDHVFTRQVPLPSGGSIVIDETEALVAIDVNSGKTKEKNIEDTAFQANLEAAEEIGRQCMLRDLGGLIVLDLIDMKDSARKKKVEAAVKKAFKNDKARTRFGRISSFGIMEMSRQRLRTSVRSRTFLTCPHCEGTGKVRSDETAAVRVLRQLRSIASSSRAGYVRADLPPSLAHYLLNQRRRELSAIERETRVRIEIFDDPAIVSNNVRFDLHEVEPRTEPLTRDSVVRVHASDPGAAVATVRERRGGEQRQKALTMYHPDLMERDAEIVPEIVPEVVEAVEAAQGAPEPPAPAASPAAAPAEAPALAPEPAVLPPPLPAAALEPEPAPVQRWSGSLESRPVFGGEPVQPARWGATSAAEAEERSRPLRWLRRLFGAPEPAPAPHSPRPRTIVVPRPPDELGGEEELPAVAPPPAAAAAPPKVTAPVNAGPPRPDRAAEGNGEKAEEARRRRRRGGRGRRKPGAGEGALPNGPAAATPTAPAAPSGPPARPSAVAGPADAGAEGGGEAKKGSRRRRPRRAEGGASPPPEGGAAPKDAAGGDPPNNGAPRDAEGGGRTSRRRRPRRSGEAGGGQPAP
jgi:ribonuclease E